MVKSAKPLNDENILLLLWLMLVLLDDKEMTRKIVALSGITVKFYTPHTSFVDVCRSFGQLFIFQAFAFSRQMSSNCHWELNYRIYLQIPSTFLISLSNFALPRSEVFILTRIFDSYNLVSIVLGRFQIR